MYNNFNLRIMTDEKVIAAWQRYCKNNGIFFQYPTLYWVDDENVELTNCNGGLAKYNTKTQKFTLPSECGSFH